jgi:hypothetical protein
MTLQKILELSLHVMAAGRKSFDVEVGHAAGAWGMAELQRIVAGSQLEDNLAFFRTHGSTQSCRNPVVSRSLHWLEAIVSHLAFRASQVCTASIQAIDPRHGIRIRAGIRTTAGLESKSFML